MNWNESIVYFLQLRHVYNKFDYKSTIGFDWTILKSELLSSREQTSDFLMKASSFFSICTLIQFLIDRF